MAAAKLWGLEIAVTREGKFYYGRISGHLLLNIVSNYLTIFL
jgi:hypothetical protein